MRQIRGNQKESGQILVILAVAFVGLLSFAALAIDLGRVLNDRRYDQNVADSAALSGGQIAIQDIKWLKPDEFNCNTNGQWVSSMGDSAWVTKPDWLGLDDTHLDAILDAAKASAAVNNKTDLADGLTTQNGVAVACGTDSTGTYLDVKVMVSSITSTSFAQIFNGGPIRNSVEAVARTYPRQAALNGYGIYALDPGCVEGILIDGGGNQAVNVKIEAGGAFSRSCVQSTGHGSMWSATTISCLESGSSHSSWCDPNDPNFTPRLTFAADPLKGKIPYPDCNNRTIAPAQTITGATLSPGYYAGGLPGHSALTLLPGLYCISGSVKENGGGSLTSVPGNGYPAGVTLVFMDGGYSQTGNGFMTITAASPDVTVPAAPNVVRGTAIIFAKGNNNTLNLGGNSLTSIIGTVYAPESEIILGGTGDVPASTQFIGFKFKYHGTEMEHLIYNGGVVYWNPPTLSLYK